MSRINNYTRKEKVDSSDTFYGATTKNESFNVDGEDLADSLVELTRKISKPNLLRDAYFCDEGFNFNYHWKKSNNADIEIHTFGIEISEGYIYQELNYTLIKNYLYLSDKNTFTASAYDNMKQAISYTLERDVNSDEYQSFEVFESGVVCWLDIDDTTEIARFCVGFNPELPKEGETSTIIIAVKLECGNYSTLSYYDHTTNGYELNTISFPQLNMVSNPQLFINPDFSIHERNESPKTSGGYVIDRWYVGSNYSTIGDVELGENSGITLHSYTSSPASNLSDIFISQRLDYITKAKYLGTTFTWTIKVAAITGEWTLYENSSGMLNKKVSTVGIHSFTWTPNFRHSSNMLQLVISSLCGQECEITIDWMKLEAGSIATPFVPPDPATELMKCQRYYEVGRSNDMNITMDAAKTLTGVRFKVNKRINPTVKVYTNEALENEGYIYSVTYAINVKTNNTTSDKYGINSVGIASNATVQSTYRLYFYYTADAEIY